MPIPQVSFGRTIQVNPSVRSTSIETLKRVVDLVNGTQPKKGEEQFQQQLKDVFHDTNEGKALSYFIEVEPNKFQSFVVTGKESNSITSILAPFEEGLSGIRAKYNGEYSKEEDCFLNCYPPYEEKIEAVIMGTKEPLQINVGYSYAEDKLTKLDVVI